MIQYGENIPFQTQGQASLKPWIYHINKSQSEKNIYRCPLVTDVYTFCRGNWNSVLLFWQCLLNYFNYSSIYHGLFNLHLLCFLPLFTNKYYLISDFVIKNGTGRDPREKSGSSASEVSQIIFGEKHLEYQLNQFVSSGGQTVNILLSGKTGVGKSYLTNALLGESLAVEGYDIDPQTDNVSSFDIDSYSTF